MIRVLIAEDQAMIRSALASLLSLEDDIEVVGARSSAATSLPPLHAEPARRRAPRHRDARPRRDHGRGRAPRELPETRTLILTTFSRPGYLRRALENGASGFLLKDAPASELAAAIRQVVAGGRALDAELAAEAITQGASPLTSRERDVLVAAPDYATAAEIARHLHLSEGTVRNYLSSAIRKLRARNRAEALHLAEEKGWL